MSRPLGAISKALGGELLGDPSLLISRLAPLASARSDELSFVAQARYESLVQTTGAGALIVPPVLRDVAMARGSCIVADDPYLYFARLTQWWRSEHEPAEPAHIDASASIHPTATIGNDVSIAAYAVVGPKAMVGSGARIGPHVVLGRAARVGEHSRLYARVSIGDRCVVGQRCILHPGVVIGADGFGFAPHAGEWVKIEQLGAVRIGDDVEIGANTCVDRGALDDTVIGNGVKLDNLIQIGHNVRIGDHTAMAGCVGVAGTATIGSHCTVGGGAIVLGHLTVADRVNISAATVVTRSIHKPGLYTGMFPIDDNAAWEKNAAALKQLGKLRERVRALEQRTDSDKT
jgi:UDP-3-O-[3-hydroxymyristoyl] glucosamine N-acyltransferase